MSQQPAYGGTAVRRPAALMVHKSVWMGWSDAAPVRPPHVENESDHFYGAQVWMLSPSPILPASR